MRNLRVAAGSVGSDVLVTIADASCRPSIVAGVSMSARASQVGASSTLVPMMGSLTPWGTPGPLTTMGMRSECS